MKYFFLSLLILTLLVIGIFGFRGQKSAKPPIEIFPDMDRQDKILSQKPSTFFHDGFGARLPVLETLPHASDDGIFPVEFGAGMTGYYYTGSEDDYWGNGLPEELALGEENIEAFLRRGQERYEITCTPCHGSSGNGKGIASFYGIPGIKDLHTLPRTSYPDGRLYNVITKGQGGMGGYASVLPVRDRWAVVAYVRALQAAFKTPVADSGEQESPTASN